MLRSLTAPLELRWRTQVTHIHVIAVYRRRYKLIALAQRPFGVLWEVTASLLRFHCASAAFKSVGTHLFMFQQRPRSLRSHV